MATSAIQVTEGRPASSDPVSETGMGSAGSHVNEPRGPWSENLPRSLSGRLCCEGLSASDARRVFSENPVEVIGPTGTRYRADGYRGAMPIGRLDGGLSRRVPQRRLCA